MSRNWYKPFSVANAVKGLAFSARGICQYPFDKSTFVRYLLLLPISWNKSSGQTIDSASKTVILFNDLMSMQYRLDPSRLLRITDGLQYGLLDGSMIPALIIRFTSSRMVSRMLCGTGHGLFLMGSV